MSETRQPPPRYRLNDTRLAITHKFTILQPKHEITGANQDCEGYMNIGMFSDGQPGEMFLHIQGADETLAGMAEMFAITISMLFQSGWTVEMLARKFKYNKFGPRGLTKNPQIPLTDSIVDYIFKWLELRFCPKKT